MLEMSSEKEVAEILSGNPTITAEPLKNEEVQKIPLVLVENLPSGFMGYPENTKISYEPITLGELEALNSGGVDIMRGLAMILKSIHCNTLAPEDLYYWDVIYIGIQRKLLAFGETKGVLYATCPLCGNIVEHTFSYTDLAFRDMKAPDLPVRTTIQGKEVEFAPLTMKEFLELDTNAGEIGIYAKMIKNIPFEEALELLKNCFGQELKKVQYIDRQLDYGIDSMITICDNNVETSNPDYDASKKNSPKTISKKCGCEVRMEVRSPFEITFPEDIFEGYSDTDIQYGKK